MKLYSFSGSCGLGTNIVLDWTGQPFTVQMVQKDDLKTPEMLKLNPNHQVPILDDNGWVLVENAAIMNYLADLYPDAKLGGDGTPRGRAVVNRWLSMINSDMHPTFKPLFGVTAYLDDATAIEKTKTKAKEALRKYFEECDTQLANNDWIAGNHRSIADAYLFVVTHWAHVVGVDLAGLDNLQRFEKTMRADSGVQNALKTQGLAG